MHVRFLLGPAGSGKTFRCLTEMRHALSSRQEGPPLLLVAPKQTTYQLERQFLAYPSIRGYTRLHILSFERLAHFVFERFGKTSPAMLDEEGRLMVLRGLLARKREDLKLFRASARLTGFARELSRLIRELQRTQQTPESLLDLAAQLHQNQGLAGKLQDLAILFREYLDWLNAHELKDSDCLLSAASECLGQFLPQRTLKVPNPGPLWIENLCVDGFADFSEQELGLLAALLPFCHQATITFCLDRECAEKISWLSSWSAVRKAFEDCKKRLQKVSGAETITEVLLRQPNKSRFVNNPVLQHLEKYWVEPQPFQALTAEELGKSLRVASCINPEAEATLAAREIRRYVRAGGRYRDVMVLVRKLEGYHDPLQRVFTRYGIPFFLDRREAVSHHPMAELTRSALRLVSRQWSTQDWFAALKTGLVPAQDADIDRLENEALARGWKGTIWQKPITVPAEPDLTAWLAKLHHRLVPPFAKLQLALAGYQNRPTGPQLAQSLREFWSALRVEERLQQWAAGDAAGSDLQLPGSVHTTVWEQMNGWAANVELAFPKERLSLREWLPILDAGLANLTVGVIPPALDQVLIGALDRSRNPDIKLALVLGMNETVFPAMPESTALLTDADRQELENRNVMLGSSLRRQLARERYYAYIACTRARERVVLTCSLQGSDGALLNPSPFLSQLHQLFPTLPFEQISKSIDWREADHVSEIVGTLLEVQNPNPAEGSPQPPTSFREMLAALPGVALMLERLARLRSPQLHETLAPEMVERLYGSVLRSSVSRMEQFAACPFKFFVHSGLRAVDRITFELDIKEQGSFQHDVLALFHQSLHAEHKRWHELTPVEARERVAKLAVGLTASYRDGLLQATPQSRFLAGVLNQSLQDFVETLVGWMRTQYRFEPVEVELPFGENENSPAWIIPLEERSAERPSAWAGRAQAAPNPERASAPRSVPQASNGQFEFDGLVADAVASKALRRNMRRLEIYGRIDRVDLFREPGGENAFCVVMDYKSSQKQLDSLLMAHGLQLQLLTYLNVLRCWPNPAERFGVKRLVPAGVFYVNLRGKYPAGQNRRDALEDPEQARRNAYRHLGRFDSSVLRLLDSRKDAEAGDQFSYRLTKKGQISRSCHEALASPEFNALLQSVETNLQQMGRAIFAGSAKVDPYRKGSATACDQCDYRGICRIDPWSHSYRVLRELPSPIPERGP